MNIKKKQEIKTRRYGYLLFSVFFGLLFFAGYLFSDSKKDDFASGCDYYKTGRFEKALEQFKMLENDEPSVNLFYNIGNTYYRLGRPGLALLYYERARKISPSNDDVNFNIKYLAGIINDQDYGLPLIARLGAAHVKLLFSISLFLFAAVVSIKLFMPQIKMFWPVMVSILFFSVCSILYFMKYRRQQQTEAVVVNNAEIRSGPDNNFKVNFTFPEGKKVIVLGKSGDWAEVGVKSMSIRGWLELKFIEII